MLSNIAAFNKQKTNINASSSSGKVTVMHFEGYAGQRDQDGRRRVGESFLAQCDILLSQEIHSPREAIDGRGHFVSS